MCSYMPTCGRISFPAYSPSRFNVFTLVVLGGASGLTCVPCDETVADTQHPGQTLQSCAAAVRNKSCVPSGQSFRADCSIAQSLGGDTPQQTCAAVSLVSSKERSYAPEERTKDPVLLCHPRHKGQRRTRVANNAQPGPLWFVLHALRAQCPLWLSHDNAQPCHCPFAHPLTIAFWTCEVDMFDLPLSTDEWVINALILLCTWIEERLWGKYELCSVIQCHLQKRLPVSGTDDGSHEPLVEIRPLVHKVGHARSLRKKILDAERAAGACSWQLHQQTNRTIDCTLHMTWSTARSFLLFGRP